MSVYTRPKPAEDPFLTFSSPGLIFQKWQAWDQFTVDKKFDRTDSRLSYLQNIAEAVQKVYQNTYPAWHGRYLSALKALGVDTSIEYETVWRLLVGWGSNPTLEAGLTLHHLYGFPYIPGSAVKGLLHHCAEMEVMNKWPSAISPESLKPVLQKLRVIKTLFGSIHLERGKKKGSPERFGPECPKTTLEDLKEKFENQSAWKETIEEIDALLNNHTGGMLCFYDAIPELPPAPESSDSSFEPLQWLLQTDIVNCHYNEYYGSDGDTPPSDDQNPNPVTFLAVRPGAKFIFPFRLAEWPVVPGRDKEEEARLQVLHDFTQQSVIAQIKTWLQTALGECGLGAKTAAGYGYFDTGAIAPPEATNAPPIAPTPLPEVTIIPVAPPPFKSNLTPAAKISGIGKDHNPALWQKLAANDYIEKIEGKSPSLKSPGVALPAPKISPNGRTLQVFYQNAKFYCEVTLKLQGIDRPGQAQHLWENVILPELKKS